METVVVGTVRSISVREGERVRTAIRLDGIPATILADGRHELPIGQPLKVKGRLRSDGDGRLTLWTFDVAGLDAPNEPEAFFTALGRIDAVDHPNGYPVITLDEGSNGRGDRQIIALPGFPILDAMRGKRVQVQGRIQFREEEDSFFHTRTTYEPVGLKLNLLAR